MTPEQTALVIDLALGRVSEDLFLDRFGRDPRLDPGVVQELFEQATTSRQPSDVECAIIVAAHFGALTSAHVGILNDLLGAPWHTKHEDIALALQALRDPSSVEPLFRAATTKHAYLDYDEGHALARKCTWALAAIGTPDARMRLEELSHSEDPIVAEYARKRSRGR